MDDRIIVREATGDDVLDITELHNAVIEEGLLAWSEPRTEDQTLKWLDYLDGLQYPRLAAVADGQLVACAAFEPIWSYTNPGNGRDLCSKLHLFVKQEHRKDGLASRLFEELCAHQLTTARQLYRIESRILSINTAAWSWLLSMGFHACCSLSGVAERNGVSIDEVYFDKFISPSPPVQGLGFPDSATPSPYICNDSALPIRRESVRIRDATMQDLPDILAMKNYTVLRNDATAHSVPQKVSERTSWLAGLLKSGLPCLLAVAEDIVVGYACLNPCTVEVTMYLRMDMTRQRIGQQLWQALLKHKSIRSGEITSIIADVDHNNGMGCGSVLKIGFSHKVSISRGFYKHGQMQGYSLYQYCLAEAEETNSTATAGSG